MILILVDGRQPNYSEGLTLLEFARLFAEFGAWNAINFDGGGSTTLAIQNEKGQPEILNCPVDNYIPGRERPVANHLGITARRVTP
jgi:exopolysaccharide biosynthesis protein